eukprot:Phypoly_transcript_03613.p1 GENE.Phypoly_transcript_03613~~Phypoly_transcript_03613.p1  ORF type:complete len:792 (+),score=79.66 Phypoly_transcript_03613:110-2377(+)
MTTWYVQRTLETVQHTDYIKEYTSRREGITYVAVPCWWDGTPESLAGLIKFQRPDLSHSLSIPGNPFSIALNASSGFFPSKELPGVGELMLASFPNDSKFIHSILGDVWWVGEKYDGIRCCWDPFNTATYSRAVNEIPLLESITKSLPATFVDGELWFGRGMFSNTFALLQGNIESTSWPNLRMVAFDVPSYDFQEHTFEQRYSHLMQHVEDNSLFCIVVSRARCRGSAHLAGLIGTVISDGGEGVILRKMGSLYTRGRSNEVLKVKSSLGDKEGLVVESSDEHVTLKLPTGQIFKVPNKNVHIPAPAKGDIVTFSYEVHARRELPVNAEIYRVRTDLSWKDVLLNSLRESKSLNTHLENFTNQPPGYWSNELMRAYMEDVAKKFDMDPLLPSTWYSIPYQDIYQSKTGKVILQKFKGHYVALCELFPEVSLDSSILQLIKSETRYRRKVFEDYAQENGFDPLVPDNWYAQPPKKLLNDKGLIGVVHNYYQGNFPKTLVTLFPDIGLEPSKFMEKSYWDRAENRREFFISYAKAKGFDHLIASNWYMQNRKEIYATKGAYMVLAFHKYTVAKALLDLFPDIGLSKAKLKIKPRSSFSVKHVKGRRKFFMLYARAHGFDPLVPEKWYSQSLKSIMNFKDGTSVLARYGNKLSYALGDVFPDIGIDKSKLQFSAWRNVQDRRNFFEEFAKENNFDALVPQLWYAQTTEKIMAKKGTYAVLWHHKGSIVRALIDLFPDIGLHRTPLQRVFQFRLRRDS